ncbi:MAG: hypothetical protein Kow0031_19130 [Anaerolineae bacterium]
MKKSLDALVLFALVIARVRIDTLADAVLPQRHEDVRQLVSGWWPAWSLDLLAHPETDPVSMMLLVVAFALLAAYLLLDFVGRDDGDSRAHHTAKLALIYGIIIVLVFGKSLLLINLRQLRGPASYSHDGGVIQTEATIDYFLQGLNPYVEDYVNTPMAEWGFSEYRTALYHYPYLPWTFVFSAPFYLASHSLLGWFDERLVYLLLFALTLLLTQKLVRGPQEQRLALMLVGLNPILAVSLIFGENDPFVLAWVVLGLWLLQKERPLWGSAALGLACASKPTAWFLAPFWLLYLLRDDWGERLIPPPATWKGHLLTLLRRGWTLPVVALAVNGPWLLWNPAAMYDDVWRWSAGLGPTGYQIWGWGGSNLVLAFGLVSNRFEYWPFIIPGALVGIPLLLLLLRRQAQHNSIGVMLYGYSLFLLVFFYLSRFLQPNYLGYILALFTLAVLVDDERVNGKSANGK